MMISKSFFLSVFFLLALLCPVTAHAESVIVIGENVQMGLGDAFMAEGEYYRAVTEYKKFLILFPDSPQVPKALFQIGVAYFQGKEYLDAAHAFARVRQNYSAQYFVRAAFLEGVSYAKLGRHQAAISAFDRAMAFDVTDPNAANALLGKALANYDLGNLARSRGELRQFLKEYSGDPRTAGVRESLAELDRYQEQPRKSRLLAGTLSAVVPGSGQMYAGRYRDGLMALVVNGLFVSGTVLAVKDENYPLAAIVGGIGLPFYIGNIYGAANAANKYNLGLTGNTRNSLLISLDYHF
jgi:tetratricopeptide (TPR) repeat protein